MDARYSLAFVVSPPPFPLSLDRDLVFGSASLFFSSRSRSPLSRSGALGFAPFYKLYHNFLVLASLALMGNSRQSKSIMLLEYMYYTQPRGLALLMTYPEGVWGASSHPIKQQTAKRQKTPRCLKPGGTVDFMHCNPNV